MNQTVVGVFDRYAAARSAADSLAAKGIDRDHIHVKATRSDDGMTTTTTETEQDTGFLAGVRSFFAEVFGSDDYTEEAGTYAEAVRRGNAVVTVDADESQIEVARETLESAGAVDIDQQVTSWRQSGWSGFDETARPYTDEDIERERQTMPVIKEELEVGKRKVSGGAVRVYSHVVSEPVSESVNLRSEKATVERRPADRPASQADLDNLEDRTIEVKETTEKPVVNKTARVVEEVVVGKEVRKDTQKVQDTVRRTDVKVERVGDEDRTASTRMSGTTGMAGTTATTGMAAASGMTGTRRPFEDYDAEFRSDYNSRYASMGGTYDDYLPAYRYGYTMAGDPRYQGKDWTTIESDARRDWEAQYPGSAWERFKAAIRHGWDRMTS